MIVAVTVFHRFNFRDGLITMCFFKLISFQIPYKNFEQVGKNFTNLL